MSNTGRNFIHGIRLFPVLYRCVKFDTPGSTIRWSTVEEICVLVFCFVSFPFDNVLVPVQSGINPTSPQSLVLQVSISSFVVCTVSTFTCNNSKCRKVKYYLTWNLLFVIYFCLPAHFNIIDYLRPVLLPFIL